MTERRRLAFVSPRFLFPADSGGKIRSTQILRGLKDGAFSVSLVMPATAEQRRAFAADIHGVCDEHVCWQPPSRSYLSNRVRRLRFLFGEYPVPVASDVDPQGIARVRQVLDAHPDVVVFDFPHSVVLAPERLPVPSVLFTHNIESEIFKRHRDIAKSRVMKLLWNNQYAKMCKFERAALERFDSVITVSDRDRHFFGNEWNIDNCHSIPTGVDTDYFRFQAPEAGNKIVFCGSMDWMANVDGIEYFHDAVWPLVKRNLPHARMQVVGRTPPGGLVRRIAAESPDWEFTGFVEDVREYVGGSGAFVIPLRVGGGTRIKAYEAMASGVPVVSTSIGIEGLPVIDGEHFLLGDSPDEMADAIVRLAQDATLRHRLAMQARKLVEENFGFRQAARVFEKICLATIDTAGQSMAASPEEIPSQTSSSRGGG